MIYRDRPVRCPRCSVDVNRDETRERWHCARCGGILLSVAEVARELLETAPDLLPEGGKVAGVSTISRRSTEPPLLCGVCSSPMAPVFLGGVEVDRCHHDELLWFDGIRVAGSRLRDELDFVISIARVQSEEREDERRRSWLLRLLS